MSTTSTTTEDDCNQSLGEQHNSNHMHCSFRKWFEIDSVFRLQVLDIFGHNSELEGLLSRSSINHMVRVASVVVSVAIVVVVVVGVAVAVAVVVVVT